ncbi:zinc-ribbon domain-containing protein [Porcipelethomonas ammoniilytica]|uniref:zinc ribbon domain-containing protein n=1 Tax=Porcipelethomonas ammoniilytica TaxID=2981722 RepID=UPI00082045D1|nr:zinc ribbon domain-containing protein [Porcipelethomonas ammoniilytica]MCU6720234.1 zinc-ribbon domain-containing protein [Porcipelethomonas ammoniilytica]SCJ06223.1 Uncharacterised protein [uncultured Ruminococcus sp.]
MFCRQCGNEMNEESKFCSKCGTPISANAQSKPNSARTGIQTREDLISGLQNAIYLMKQATALKESSAATIRKQTTGRNPSNEITGGLKVLFSAAVGFVGFLIGKAILGSICRMILNGFGSTNNMPLLVQLFYYVISGIIPIALGIVVGVYFNKNIIPKINEKIRHKNVEIIQANQKIAEYNQSIRQQADELNRRLHEIQLRYQNTVMTWYPQNYCYIEATEFFLDSVVNYRADTLKEAINLYEEYLHRERVERNQESMLKKQDLNNLLTLGSVIMQGQVLSAVHQNTAAVNDNTSAVHGVASAVEENTQVIRERLYR